MNLLWSPLAEQTYFDNLEYLHENWSPAVVHQFINDVEQTMELIIINPHIFNWWDAEKKFKIGYINKHVSFFYSFNEKEIFVHLFWNNHRDPSVLKKYL